MLVLVLSLELLLLSWALLAFFIYCISWPANWQIGRHDQCISECMNSKTTNHDEDDYNGNGDNNI